MSPHKRLKVYPQTTPLQGRITVPADKSISHRAVMLAAIAQGASTIRNWLPAGDTLATLGVIQALGVTVEIEKKSARSWDLSIEGRGWQGLQPATKALDCANAGTCMRLLAGLLAGQTFATVLDGTPQLRRRPMGRITRPLQAMGANIDADAGRAPLHIKPARLTGINYDMPVASAQVKSALLLAGLYAEGKLLISQPGPARDHTERMLQAMGLPLQIDGHQITLPAERPPALTPLEMTVPGDISSAAFPLVAAAIVPGSQVTVTGVGVNDTRTGLLDILTSMEADITLHNEAISGGEAVADIALKYTPLQTTKVAGELVVRAIDELPIWAVAAAGTTGQSQVSEAAELRVKEVDRIAMLAGELRRIGVDISAQADGFTIAGPAILTGEAVHSHGDHRLGMALAVAALTAVGPTTIADAGCISDSFPGFVASMQTLGARMEWDADEHG